MSAAKAADRLGVTRAYAWMLATGRATPSFSLAAKIERLTLGEVPAVSWASAWRRAA